MIDMAEIKSGTSRKRQVIEWYTGVRLDSLGLANIAYFVTRGTRASLSWLSLRIATVKTRA